MPDVKCQLTTVARSKPMSVNLTTLASVRPASSASVAGLSDCRLVAGACAYDWAQCFAVALKLSRDARKCLATAAS